MKYQYLLIVFFLTLLNFSCKTRYEQLLTKDKLRAVMSDSSEAYLHPETNDTIISGRIYYQNDSSKVLISGKLFEGYRIGVWCYYFHEQLIEKRIYRNGVLKEAIFYTPRYW